MEKTLIICDSTCDLSLEFEKKSKIRIVNCSVTLDGKSYRERIEINADQVYKFVEKTGTLPHHSQITVFEFVEEYVKASRDGYTGVICLTMNSQGSGTNSAAHHAISMLEAEYAEIKEKLNIRVIDSKTYAAGIVNGLLPAIEMLNNGHPMNEVADAMEDYFNNQITLIGLYSLTYAKKSGRLNASAAIVGEALGIKPILGVAGYNKVLGKVRGDKNLIPKLVSMYMENAADPINGDYCVSYGDNLEDAKQFIAEMKKAGAREPLLLTPIGTCVATNSGPKVIGVGFRKKSDI